jgi:Leucine-rich repeat (LRR) protein
MNLLPAEIKVNFLKYLNKKELRIVSTLNNEFRMLSIHTLLIFKKFKLNQLPEEYIQKVRKLKFITENLDFIEKYPNIDYVSFNTIIFDKNCYFKLNTLNNLKTVILDNIVLKDIEYFRTINGITKLSLNHCKVGDLGAFEISKIQSLVNLEICGNNLTNNGITYISKLTNLKYLNIGQNYFDQLGLQKISELNLIHINLNRIKFNLSMIKILSNMKILSLSLFYSCLSEEYVTEISKISTLVRLSIKFCFVTPDGAKQLAKLNNLRYLDISDNELYNIGAIRISQMRNLVKLDISSNNITRSGITKLINLKNLTTLNISKNVVTRNNIFIDMFNYIPNVYDDTFVYVT